ncbi:hypothetical protein L3Y34_004454 [Caenorhabditis briggsae]|uniref:Ig-like domain-containing protein n=1 Tax=Caenorhabditis briggsae TaxID=6238 RepID=A0AAE9D537_CAEBR|nr:hypothetical protein L3Y34_004454 [Caenorhabditis briggsae]
MSMRSVLFLLVSSVVWGRQFVLLDPDDSDIEETASNISDLELRARSLRLAKFRKWLKYDVDCDFISRHELEVKISQGKCPFQPEIQKTTTTTKAPKSIFFKRKRKPIPAKDKSLFSHENKETVVRAIVGNNKMQEMDLTPITLPELSLISGSMVTFECDQENRKKNGKKKEEVEFVEWFVNGKRIDPSWFDWRVSVSIDGKLGVWPIGVDDSGHFECLADGQLKSSVTVKVIPVSTVLISGLFNYLFVCAVFAVATTSIGCLLGNRNQEKKEVEVDRMEDFLAENVFKTDQMAKERVAKLIEQQGMVDEQHLIENKAKSNRSTIMILLQKPQMKNLKNQNANNTTSTDTGTEGTSTGKFSDTNVTTTGTTTGTTTVETELGTTVMKTDEEQIGASQGEALPDEESEEDEEVGAGASSNGSTGTSNASKGTSKGNKTKKASKDKKNRKTTKKSAGNGKKNVKQASKPKEAAKGAVKNTKKKTVSKPAPKKKR